MGLPRAHGPETAFREITHFVGGESVPTEQNPTWGRRGSTSAGRAFGAKLGGAQD
jgi:hypothetical protein